MQGRNPSSKFQTNTSYPARKNKQICSIKTHKHARNACDKTSDGRSMLFDKDMTEVFNRFRLRTS